MKSCEQFIKLNNFFNKGDRIGVAVSGGSDSVALLHFLSLKKDVLGIDLVVLHIDHGIREESEKDCNFVEKMAKEIGVSFHKFKVDVPKLAKESGESLETVAREARYSIFKKLIENKVVDKIALAHHKNDQAETILMHIFRGSGVSGAKGMEPISNGIYIRPLLDTSKDEILKYINENKLSYCEDYTNSDNSYSRNFVRNVIMKEITSRWENAIDSIVNFGKSAGEDDSYISSQIDGGAVIEEGNAVKIPLSYFVYHSAIIARIIFKAMRNLGINRDVERKHIALITNLALNGENGKKINLPFDVLAVKEYDYLTLHKSKTEKVDFEKVFKCGEFFVDGFGTVKVKKGDATRKEGFLMFDKDKLPKDAIWRFRKEGDIFVRFGGVRKKLKSYFIDKKIPSRLRDNIPILASGNEVYLIAGDEISDKIKVDENSKKIYIVGVDSIV